MDRDKIPDWALTEKQIAARGRRRAKVHRKKVKAVRKLPVNGSHEDFYGEYYNEGAGLALIVAMHEQGYRPFQIAEFMNQKSIQVRGKRWYETTVLRIIERVEKRLSGQAVPCIPGK